MEKESSSVKYESISPLKTEVNIRSQNPRSRHNILLILVIVIFFVFVGCGGFLLGKYFFPSTSEDVNSLKPLINDPGNTYPTTKHNPTEEKIESLSLETIVFIKKNPNTGGGTISFINKDRSNEKSLNQETDVTSSVKLSPDRKWIAFQYKRNIWKIAVDGSNLQQLTFQGRETTEDELGIETVNPQWSLNSKQILYRLDRVTQMIEPPNAKEPKDLLGLWIMDADGKNQKNIVQENDGTPGEYTFIHNSTTVFCTKSFSPLFSVDTLTGKKQILFSELANILGLSTNTSGRIIVFTSAEHDNNGWREPKLIGVDLEKNQYHILKENQTTLINNPEISPSGDKVVFMETVDGYNGIYAISFINFDGTGYKELFRQKYSSIYKWMPDNKTIVYTKGPFGNSSLDIETIDVATGKQNKITNNGNSTL